MSPDPGTASESYDSPANRAGTRREAPTLKGAMASLRTEPSRDLTKTHPFSAAFRYDPCRLEAGLQGIGPDGRG